MPVRYITVTPVTNLFKPATRAFGDIAIVGATDSDATSRPANTPIAITNPDDLDGNPVDSAANFKGDLGKAIRKAFEQTPGPMKVWGVRTDPAASDTATGIGNALTEVAKLNVQIVTLANTPLTSSSGSTEIEALSSHVSTVSSNGGDGKERIGVAMLGKDVTDVTGPSSVITSNMTIARMVMIAHKSDEDAAAAVAGAIAGYEPHISLLLKPVKISMDGLFSDAEIDAFNSVRVNWLTDPVLIPGQGIFMGEGYTLGADMPYIDIPRTIDDISFRLKASLIRSIGKLRVSRSGLRALASQMTAVLEPLRQKEVIEGYDVFLPLLVLLDKDPTSLTDAERQQINNAQNERTVGAIVSVDYAGAIHRLKIDLIFE